ncbi:hypothetical protein SGPA1_60010 [Streptomyces misionensis JCM 4497]
MSTRWRGRTRYESRRRAGLLRLRRHGPHPYPPPRQRPLRRRPPPPHPLLLPGPDHGRRRRRPPDRGHRVREQGRPFVRRQPHGLVTQTTGDRPHGSERNPAGNHQDRRHPLELPTDRAGGTERGRELRGGALVRRDGRHDQPSPHRRGGRRPERAAASSGRLRRELHGRFPQEHRALPQWRHPPGRHLRQPDAAGRHEDHFVQQ